MRHNLGLKLGQFLHQQGRVCGLCRGDGGLTKAELGHAQQHSQTTNAVQPDIPVAT